MREPGYGVATILRRFRGKHLCIAAEFAKRMTFGVLPGCGCGPRHTTGKDRREGLPPPVLSEQLVYQSMANLRLTRKP